LAEQITEACAKGGQAAAELAGVATLAAAGTSALAAFGVRKRAEPLVTPVADPRDNDGTTLVPIPGA
jgi:hypothetical protein